MLPPKVDVLVIGAGVLGAATSYYLSCRGIQTLVIDKGEAAGGASGANLGQISLLDREPGPHLELARQSLSIYGQLAKEWGRELGYKQTGGLVVLDKNEDLTKAAAIVAAQKQAGLECFLLTPEEATGQEPFLDPAGLTGAVYCPGEGKLDPFTVTLGFLDAARDRGVELVTGTAVTGFEIDGNNIVSVATGKGMIAAKVVVLATGAWTRELAARSGLDLPIYYHRGGAMVSLPVPPAINGPVVGGGFLSGSFVQEQRVGLAAVQETNGSVLIGQATDWVEDYDVGLTYTGIIKTAAKFLSHFPKLQELAIVRMWAGVTPYTADNWPLFGFSSKIHNLFLVAGFKGAFTVAPAVGQAAAEVIGGGCSTIDCSFFNPKRFNQ
ncbi:FAD-dependent oxidoreductase [Moorella naiadis]|uniref:NAD(P)/FAD-dependent oxidoreductase n=1 Tax=Moorella naiadis (nom. illeg.) TaxID=3093670 RepID=UPI003D9C850D